MNRISKIITLSVFFAFTFISVKGQSEYKKYYKNTDKLITELGKDKKILEQGVVIYNQNDVINFFFDEKNKQPYVVEDNLTDLLWVNVLSDYQNYYAISGEETLDGPYQFREKSGSFEEAKKQGALRIGTIGSSNETQGIFYQDITFKQFSLNSPGLSSTKAPFKYYGASVKTSDLKFFTGYYFNSSGYFVLNGTLTINIPAWMDIEIIERNFEDYAIKSKTKVAKNIKTITYTFEEISRKSGVENSPGSQAIEPHLIFIVKGYNHKKKSETIFATTQDLYNWYNSLALELTNDKKELKPLVDSLTKNAGNNYQKIQNIFYWIQDNIRYIAFEDGLAGFKPDEASKVYKNKYGDCKGVANLAKVMLEIAGVDARLTWIGTRGRVYGYSIPSLMVDNHMICTAIDGDTMYHIDPTETFVSMSDYAHRIQGQEVLIQNGDTFMVRKVPVLPSIRNLEKVNISYTIDIDSLLLIGNERLEYNGEARTNLIRQYENITQDKKEEEIEKFLRKSNPGMMLDIKELPDFKNRDNPLVFSFDFKLKNRVSVSKDKILVPICISSSYFSGVNLEDRTVDYWFYRKYYCDITQEFKIPAGYVVENIPEGLEFSSKNFDVKVTITKEKDVIKSHLLIDIKTGEIHVEEFDSWIKNLVKLDDFYNTHIVLKKK